MCENLLDFLISLILERKCKSTLFKYVENIIKIDFFFHG